MGVGRGFRVECYGWDLFPCSANEPTVIVFVDFLHYV